MSGQFTPFPYPCEEGRRIPLFDTQHEAVRLMENYIDSGHMKACINLRLGIEDSWEGRRYGPACGRDSLDAKPFEEWPGDRRGLYSFRGCPPDCTLYQPRPGVKPTPSKPDASPTVSPRTSRPVKVAWIGAAGTIGAALVAGLLVWLLPAKDKSAQPVATIVQPTASGSAQQQVAPGSLGSTNIQAGRDVVIQIPKAEVAPTVRPGVAEELANLRHSGQKRYDEWWESCFDRQGKSKSTDPAKRAEAEKIRLAIMDTLEREVGRPEAVFFNTPRPNEPFPPNQTLSQCPEGIEIKQFGYRLDRLAEIIDRIRR